MAGDLRRHRAHYDATAVESEIFSNCLHNRTSPVYYTFRPGEAFLLLGHHWNGKWLVTHYNDLIMGAIASQITSLTIVYSIVHSDVDQRKHQSSASLAFVRGIHRGPVNSLHKWPVTRKMFPVDDITMFGAAKNRYVNQSWFVVMLSVGSSWTNFCTIWIHMQWFPEYIRPQHQEGYIRRCACHS